ncbi:hypothetical protein A1O3_00273 [Capronia epimyces CBS 606.96]|uniref:Enoyl reductase (ER) domain-containing protein n=1 Tax=Capronia epimyces CBS 606.96 TaxID=1182542 RepID=W9YGP3_9EURO|nr:uncharacterized protein A1O3_00273 [Capronia epimyces CBS 606.96]EXJ91723.1 hypothetical protein A1O3_00273 [Capronia epimyces CBS 606.96]
MKAAQFDMTSQKVVINDVPIPEPNHDQFLVKIRAASLCHSDLMVDTRPASGGPFTMGHEGVGYIERMGPGAENRGFQVGDAVGFLYVIGCCYECEGCSIQNVFCTTGKPLFQGFMADGFFAEYAVVNWQNAAKLPSSMDIRRSSPLFCAGITAFNTIDSCELQPGQWLAVVGCGGLGQFATQYAKAMGYKVVGIDINDSVLQVCKRLGADAVFNSRTDENYVEELKALTNGGVHTAAVFSGSNVAYAGAPAILRTGGLLMLVGLPPKPVEISALPFCLGAYRIKGESIGTPRRMQKAIDFTAKHNIVPDVDFRDLDDLESIVEDLKQGKVTTRIAFLF